MTNTHPEQFYKEQISNLSEEKKRQLRKKNQLAWLRFFSIILAFTIAWVLWPMGLILVVPACGLCISLFIYFLRQDITNNSAIENTDRLIIINQQELLILNHQFLQMPDGSNFQPANHSYTNDLDIFGRASLYQYINRTNSQQGNKKLADWLTEPSTEHIIIQRQDAAKELASKQQWRQQLQAYGIANPITIATEQKIAHWLLEKNQFLHKPIWKILKWALPAISLALLVLFLAGIINENRFFPAATIMMIIAFSISKLVMPAYAQLSKIAPELDTLSTSVLWIEKYESKSSYLLQLKKNFIHESEKASGKIKGLAGILERLDYRLNFIVFIPLNTFLFWDLQQIFALEKWKESNKQNISHWFDGVAEMESIATIGNITFNHPLWIFPKLSSSVAVFESTELGHPLIPIGKRITNDFSTKGVNRLNLVTGSNMAGKSTFLRSIGVNIVLAMMGSPVCAKSLTLSPMKVMSSMRISDNLEESTSTFYAELKKLKEIIEAVNRNEKIFLLLDEILRGTNSADRHTGSKSLIKQLIHHNAAGVLATHDLELAKLAQEFPANIENYHFDVQVAIDELFFDYKLKRGICQSMNASILMKKIGIEL
jgi:MutS domain V